LTCFNVEKLSIWYFVIRFDVFCVQRNMGKCTSYLFSVLRFTLNDEEKEHIPVCVYLMWYQRNGTYLGSLVNEHILWRWQRGVVQGVRHAPGNKKSTQSKININIEKEERCAFVTRHHLPWQKTFCLRFYTQVTSLL
jgi:hypothetical protein